MQNFDIFYSPERLLFCLSLTFFSQSISPKMKQWTNLTFLTRMARKNLPQKTPREKEERRSGAGQAQLTSPSRTRNKLLKITTSSKVKIQFRLISHPWILEDKKRDDDRLVRETPSYNSINFHPFWICNSLRIFFVHYNDKYMYVYHKQLNWKVL